MMPDYYKMLKEDVRFEEGLTACINCGTCTAICPAAEFFNYDPRLIAETVQTGDNKKIYELLTGDTIWYCGECMSCKTRCPRDNTPGLIIMALRHLAMKTGLFTKSEKGRQQLVIKRSIGEWILKYGYCVYREELTMDDHPEQGPTWEWQNSHLNDLLKRLGIDYNVNGPGVLRKIPEEALEEIRSIFRETGGMEFLENIEKQSAKKAREMGLEFDNRLNCEYMHDIYQANSSHHTKKA
jgi:heterodisulfide reductase subunit C